MDELFFSGDIGLVGSFSIVVKSAGGGWEDVAIRLLEVLSETLPVTRSVIIADVAKGTALKVSIVLRIIQAFI